MSMIAPLRYLMSPKRRNMAGSLLLGTLLYRSLFCHACKHLMSRSSIFSTTDKILVALNHSTSAPHTPHWNSLSEFSFNASFTKSSALWSTSLSSSSSLSIVPDSSSKPISNPLYNFLAPTQNPNNIVSLICSSLKQKSFHLNLLQNDIKDILPHMGPREISKILLRCQSDCSSALTFFNWVKNDLGIRPTVQNYCIIVHILTWSRMRPQAMKLLSELIHLVEQVSPNEDVFQNLVACTEDCNWSPLIFDMLTKAYLKVGMVEKGLGTFRKTIEAGFIPSVIVCNFLLNGLSKFNYIGHCWEVYEEMGRLGIHRNGHTFNILTHVLCKIGDTNKVNGFLEKMEEEGFEPDLVTYNTLVNSYCRQGRLGDAFHLYKIMYRRGVMPDLITYTALMNGLCREGKIREAHQLFHRMVNRGLDPDIVSYNTLIFGYCKEGKMHVSRSLLYDMIGNGVCPDSFTCRHIVEAYGRDGKLLAALNLIVELQRFRIKIPNDVFDYLIIALCQEGRPFAARNLLERISHDGYVLEKTTYNQIIESLCVVDNVDDAVVLKSEMIKKSMKPNLTAYGAIISCLCRNNRNWEAERLLEEMVKMGFLPDKEICRALIKSCCKERNVDKAESLLKLFAKEFQVYDNESYNAIVEVSSEIGQFTELMELQDRLQNVGYAPNSLTIKHVIHGLQKIVKQE
ncbi:LOW QUALITY PROTEIN: pentatricopeptide repeat-containing protein At5g40400-like [Neltuma alba]|uniref:pentatricopeptide repeat-containing protein At5g40400-like n=1 Tax=Neltuma alba TaxID=207710 RepID=UPI0010A3AEB4|nr:pentatricopeptide repeat-containing protein At5g40400-like [Prosopis alba]XP_028786293.1 LOW QUALITY PROTEIN: pentatricopeptide repeat-containing protein At5g40400-like [Prosopis alba]